MITRTPRDIWETVLGELQIQVSKPNYRTWFSKTAGLNYEDNRFVIGVPNTFVAEYLEKNQRSLIEKALIGFTSPGVQIIFQVNGKPHPPEGNGGTDAAIPSTAPAYSSLNPRYVFDAFVEGGCNRMARAAALAVARNPGHAYNPLFIYAGAGLGKTHLLHAIGHAASSNHLNVICTSAEQFTNEFVSSVREKSTEEFRNKYRSIGMLLIDDIQFISGKEQTEESFFHTFNELHNTNRQIVITSDCPPKTMPLLEERLRSRFEWGLTVDVQPPDFETRLAILQSKTRQKEVSVGLDVLDYIARRDQSNIRELEGSLNRVTAFARLLQVLPDVELATRALSDIAGKEVLPPSLTPASIVAAVAGGFQISREDLIGRKRDKDTALARRVAMYLLRQETNCSLSQIGQELGNRDAAAVNFACKKVAEDIEKSPFLKRKVRDIQRSLYATLKETKFR
ncbi:MAG: chromosomal replication initiation protein DnaA [Chloroflexi bacterium RBG_16_50_9]|nr:MAG: chromosomal replication initiation protein DnaA [Chloroflexi bacterium RBG_16_50_9]